MIGHIYRPTRSVVAALACAAALFSVAAVPSAHAEAAGQIRIGTGGAAGVYFVAGNAICRMVRAASRGSGAGRLRCAAPPSGGSIDNLDRLRDKAIDFAIVQSDWHHHAFKGTSRFAGRSMPELRSVFSLHVEPFHIVVRETSGISSWADLDGKRVNIGNSGSGHRATFEELVKAHGQTLSRFQSISTLGSTEQATAFCDDRFDAFAFTVGVPNASIAQATDGCDGKIINLETKAVGALIQKSGYYSWARIPEGTYFTSTSDVKTLGVVATLVTHADTAGETVERVASAVLGNFGRFRRLHPAFAGLKRSEMARKGLSAPLHSGALRYMTKAGLIK